LLESAKADRQGGCTIHGRRSTMMISNDSAAIKRVVGELIEKTAAEKI
jgi:hypothetical protein